MVRRSRNTEDLIADLYYLRKGEGFTPGRVRHAGILIDILGGPEQTYELMRERLLAAIDTLGPDKAFLLRAAFNIEPTVSGNTLKQRRTLYGQAISRKVDTVTNRENRAIEDLIVPLLTERYALSPYPSCTPTPSKCSPATTPSSKTATGLVPPNTTKHNVSTRGPNIWTSTPTPPAASQPIAR